MLVPVGATSFSQALRMSSEIFHALKALLQKAGHSTSVGDEGGFSPRLKNAHDALTLLQQAVQKAGYALGKTGVMFALDVAASEFYDRKKKKYVYQKEAQGTGKAPVARTTAGQVAYLLELVKSFPIISVEDGFDENDTAGFRAFLKKLKTEHGLSTIQSVGDDLFVTNPKLVQRGIEGRWANSVLVKLNQVGTLSETMQTIKKTQQAG